MSMTHGTNGTKGSEEAVPPRPPSQQSSSSGSGSSKHVKCIGRYVLTGNTLGKGNFARVEAAVHTLTRAKVAVKIIETDKIKEDYVRKNLLREAQLMRRLHHPNIIRLYETMKTNNLYCLVTEIADGGELLSYVRNDFKERRLTEATTRPFIRQLVSALHHLHSTGIVHRDLKMENILLDKKKRNVKIVDFGLSNSAKPGSLLQTHCGSPEYAAPELFIPGREYGPEVDVWSLGVNLYAMLVGKLPFRSPRQGTKRRQKLLEQITNGLSESHEKEMAHISSGARDLVGRLLQPDPRKRVHLDEVMQHPWVTKNGDQPLHPYHEQPVDQATKASVMELMSAVLEISAGEIKETVKRDRCDWLAAIYNLLIEQPEGRNILQQLMTDDPDEQLVDAAHYQGSVEHFRLSQGDSLDVSPEVASVLANAKAQVQRGYRHSLSQQENHEYSSSTLPLTKREKRHHHHSHDARPLGAPRTLHPLQPPPGYMQRRASIASPYSSPEHHQGSFQPVLDPIVAHHHQQQYQQHQYQQHQHQQHQHSSGEKKRSVSRGRRLPSTPIEEPYYRSPHDPPRPHSRAESMPDPLPIPWRHNIAPLTQLVRTPGPRSPDSSPPPKARSPLQEDSHHGQNFREPVTSPLGQLKPSKRKSSLKPLRPKSVSLGSKILSGSVDANLHLRTAELSQPGSHTMSVMWPPQKVAPARRVSVEGPAAVNLGWASANNVHRQTLPNKLGRDIQGLMGGTAPSSAYSSIRDIPQEIHQLQTGNDGSAVSVDIQPEMFKPRTMMHPQPPRSGNPHIKSGDNLKVDPISGGEKHHRSHSHHTHHNHHHHHPRSSSAKPHQHLPSGYMAGGHKQDLSSSLGYVGPGAEQQYHQSNGDIHQYDTEQDKVKNGRKNSVSGILGKFKLKNSREKSASTTLHPKAL